MRFAKDLETVAYAQYFSPLAGKTDHAFHDKAETGDRSAPEIVAIGESAGHDNQTARTVAVYQGGTINARALSAMFKQIIANNRAGGWRKLKGAG